MPTRMKPFPHLAAVLQALLVTFLWSTSWVLIKFGLEDIPALTFAGLRYTLATLILLPMAHRRRQWGSIRRLSARTWLSLVALGLLFYTVTQGAQFVGLAYLPAITVNLLLSFTTVVVALLGIAMLSEIPTVLQWIGIGLYLVGVFTYFYPLVLPAGEVLGHAVVLVGVLANAASSIIGRSINRRRDLHPLGVTVVSMGIGGLILLAAGVFVQGFPPLSLSSWAIIGWLAAVNTAFAFTLWNHTLRTLSAIESSIINNTMMIQIPILAVIFLGEKLTLREGIGFALAALGTLIVQLRPRSQRPPEVHPDLAEGEVAEQAPSLGL